MTIAELPITFERPIWLFALLLIIPAFLLALRSIGGLSRGKAVLTFAMRCIVILFLSVALAHPSWVKKGEGVTVTMVIDRSQSIPLPLKESSLNFLKEAALSQESRTADDRLSVITVARDASIAAMPDSYSEVTVGQDVADPTATNLASGVRMAIAVMPDDTANRILLVSDGNETVASVLEAAEIAKANKIPIDVVILEYEYDNEIIFDRIRAPARSRLGQTATVTMSLRSQKEAAGTIHLKMDGTLLDLNGADEGDGMRVTLQPGRNVYQLEVSLDHSGAVQFESTFEPDDKNSDYIVNNNNAYAVTFVGGEGKVLVIDDGDTESQYLMQALRESNIDADRRGPGALANLVYLTSYDAVVLANIPRYAFDDEQDRMLHAYVHDLGGGLVMLGGPVSFGAGGWIDSETSKVLPVKLDPPSSRQLPRGALALIMHSCEMPQGNYWGQKVAQSAIEALSRLDYVGIVEFNWGAGGGAGFGGASWAHPMSLVGDKSAALNATKTMVVGDMPDFGASMQVAYNGLMGVRAGQRHAIIISDGDPAPPNATLLNQYVTAKITVTTVMVGGHGTPMDAASMNNVATKTGGNFYNVTNPKNLPQIFIKEAQLVSRSLIQEGEVFQPQINSRLPGPAEGFSAIPAVDGYVLTAPREGLTQNTLVISTKEGLDPLFSSWNYGLGRSIAYTSDITGRWGGRWPAWNEFRAFWEQAMRWVMRPTGERNMTITTHQEGDLAVIEVEAVGEDTAFLDFLNAGAIVSKPTGDTEQVMLQQVGPGRYRAQFETDEAGAYIVDVSYRQGDQERYSHLQAAVAVPYSDEFKSVKHNAALMKQLADATGGRVISSADDPNVAYLFERKDLEIPRSPKRIWDLLTILAASLFIFDVAARRLTIDPAKIRGLLNRAAGKESEKTTDAVAAWKRTRSQVAHRRDTKESATKRKADAPEADRKTRFEAAEGEGEAFDVAAEATAGPRLQSQQPQRRDQGQQKPASEEEDYTSRLLKAKRRAQDKPGDDEDTSKDEGSGGHQR